MASHHHHYHHPQQHPAHYPHHPHHRDTDDEHTRQHRHAQWPATSSGTSARHPGAVKHAPPTPPMSSTFEARRPTVFTDYNGPIPGPSRVALPPIAHLDRTLSSMQPLTPPDDGELANGMSTGNRLPPILPGYHHQSPAMMTVDDPFVATSNGASTKHSLYEIPAPPPTAPVELESRSYAPHRHATYSHYEQEQPAAAPAYQPTPPPPAVCVWDSAPHLIDWLDFTRNRSAHFIAEKTCEMICYLWFAERPVTRRPTPSVGTEKGSAVNGGEHGVLNGRDASMSYPSPHHSPSSPSRVTGVTPSELSTLLSVPNSGHLSAKTLNTSPTRSSPSTLQLVATPSFISFMQKLLETTQVSQSVIVLSLHYIYRLKERNHFTRAQRGSEFRIAVAGLMMANKFLDDNTYTNKTWSEVSGIELEEINRMEREFLQGVEFNLYVDKPTYESWLNLLKGLVQAKERDSMSARSRESVSRRRDARKVSARYQPQPQRAATKPQPQYQPPTTNNYATPTRLPPLSRAVPAAAYYYPHTSANSQYTTAVPTSTAAPQTQSRPSTAITQYPRARSISPTSVDYTDVRMDDAPHSASSAAPLHPNSTNKRTAEAAFSPTSATFGHLPSKRPSSMILTIPDTSFSSGMAGIATSSTGPGYDNSPLESLSDFGRMSLVEGSPEKRQRQEQEQARYQQQQAHPQQPAMMATTLVAPYSYRVDTQGQAKPQELYFYTLASSPMEPPAPPRSRNSRKRGMSVNTSSEVAVESQDESMEDDGEDSVVEMDRDEWERERDAHGERRRTRKARLMRTQTSTSTSSNGHHGAQPEGYAYDFNRSLNTYRASQPTVQYAPVNGAGYHHHHPQQTTSAPTTLPPLVHPVPRQYVPTVVQSASTSPASGVVYVQRSGEVGYAPSTVYSQAPPATAYPPTAKPYQQPESTSRPYEYTSAGAPAPEPQQRQPPAPQPQQHHQFHPHPQFERRVSRTSSHSWYSQNQGGSVSYHPSPVLDKAEYFPVAQDRRQYEYEYESQQQSQQQHSVQGTYGQQTSVHHGAGVALPHFHDNVWAKPPAIVLANARREDEDERGRQMVTVSSSSTESSTHRLHAADISSTSRSCSSGTGRSSSTCASGTSSGSMSASASGSAMTGDEYADEYGSEDGDRDGDHGIPSAPFANAGPAGVYVPFGSEYARYQGYQQSQQQYHHQHQQPQQQQQPHPPPPQQYHQYATHGQQRDVYSASGTYPPTGSVFAPAYGYQAGKGGQARY